MRKQNSSNHLKLLLLSFLIVFTARANVQGLKTNLDGTVDSIEIYLFVANLSDTSASFLRPDAEKMSFIIIRPGHSEYTIKLKSSDRRTMWKDSTFLMPHNIYLQPHCTLKIKLGLLSLKSLGLSFVQEEHCTLVLLPSSKIEFPAEGAWLTSEPVETLTDLSVSLRSKDLTSLVLEANITNSGGKALQLKNEFYPYEQSRFHLVIHYKKDSLDTGTIIASGNPYAPLTDPNALIGYLTLLPGEALSINLDAGKYIQKKGIYEIQLVYTDNISVQNEEKPVYLEQFVWKTNKVTLIL